MTAPELKDREDDPMKTLSGTAVQPATAKEVVEDDAFCAKLVDRALLHGPNPRRKEFSLLMGVIRDFLRGFRALHFVGPNPINRRKKATSRQKAGQSVSC